MTPFEISVQLSVIKSLLYQVHLDLRWVSVAVREADDAITMCAEYDGRLNSVKKELLEMANTEVIADFPFKYNHDLKVTSLGDSCISQYPGHLIYARYGIEQLQEEGDEVKLDYSDSVKRKASIVLLVQHCLLFRIVPQLKVVSTEIGEEELVLQVICDRQSNKLAFALMSEAVRDIGDALPKSWQVSLDFREADTGKEDWPTGRFVYARWEPGMYGMEG